MSLRGYYIILSLVASAIVGWQYGHLLIGAGDALSGIIDIFAILGGVLVAVISIVGDPSMLMPGNWRVGHEHAQDIQDRIARFAHLFFIYILTVILVIIVQVVENGAASGFEFLYQILMGFVTFAFLLSITLPYSLMSIQKERLKDEIRRRKGS